MAFPNASNHGLQDHTYLLGKDILLHSLKTFNGKVSSNNFPHHSKVSMVQLDQ
jgi:hypothetical protein